VDNGLEVSSTRIITDRNTGRPKGFGYAEVSDKNAAVALKGALLDGRELNIDHSNERSPATERPARQDWNSGGGGGSSGSASTPTKTVFLGNLSFDSTEDSIHEQLQQFGEVTQVRMIYDRETERPKGFGYCEFESVEVAQKAVEASGQVDVDGRTIRIDFANERTGGCGGGRGDRGGRGGGFRGGRGDRGFRGGRGDRGGRGGGFRGRGGDRGGRGAAPSFAGKKTTFEE